MSRFLLIGLDGAEPALVSRWMDEGRLPHLAALRDRGTFLPCASTRPPVTFPAWTTCVTGVNPGRHGIFDFTCIKPGARSIEFCNSTYRKAPAIWNILSDAGKRVGVLGVPGTYPPEPVNGFLVSGFDSPVATSVDRSCVYPPERFAQMRRWRFADFQESRIGPGWHDMALDALLAKIDDKEAIALECLAEEPWDFFMVVFGESDTVAHHFWLFHDEQSPRHLEDGPRHAIRQIYERLDETVGKLCAAVDRDTVVGVVSDHGFGGAGTGVVHLNNWLAQEGYLRFTGASGESLLKRLALRLVPGRLRGALFRRFKALATAAESKSRFAGIDWSRTTAWSEELNYFPNIRVNLAGRDPDGQVPAEDYDAFVAELCARLEAWPPVARAWPRADLFEGPQVHHAPDIVLELAFEDGYSYNCLRSRGGPPHRRLTRDEWYGGKEKGMTGNHRDPGVLFLSEPTAAKAASLQDIAPTVLAALGVAAPPMDGRPLLGPAAGAAPEAARFPEETPYDGAAARVVEERLRALGYFE